MRIGFFAAHFYKKEKKMKEKCSRVELRLSAKEKKRMEDIAKKCGLSVSEYLRKRGLGYEPGPFLDDRFYAAYTQLCEISNLPQSKEAEAALMEIFNDLQQNLFLPRKQTQKEIIEEVALLRQPDSGQ